MATIKMEARHCWEINCKYLEKKITYSPDPFEGAYYCARCKHDDAPHSPYNSLGSDDSYEYCEIPDWCPIRIDKEDDGWKKRLIDVINEM